jgi:hypothetical protein
MEPRERRDGPARRAENQIAADGDRHRAHERRGQQDDQRAEADIAPVEAPCRDEIGECPGAAAVLEGRRDRIAQRIDEKQRDDRQGGRHQQKRQDAGRCDHAWRRLTRSPGRQDGDRVTRDQGQLTTRRS